MNEPAPFPSDSLPEPVRCLVVDGAAAIGCDPAMIGPVTLAAMAAAIGNARTIELQPGWREPCVLWVAVVAPSGSAKSPALEAAIRPLERRERDNYHAYSAAMADLQQRIRGRDLLENDQDDDGPEAATRYPVCERLVTTDCTLEALAALLQSSPRGILFVADELAAMLGGLSRYTKGGRQATEEARWLPFHRAGALKLDRRTSGPIRVDRAAMSIAGMIQPGVLAGMLTTTDFQSGLVARLLVSTPPIPRRVWRKGGGLPEAVEARYAVVIDRLLNLQLDADAEPVALTLDDAAERAWASYFDDLNAEMVLADERTRAMLSKLEGGAARLALVIHLGRWASGEPVNETRIDGQSMARGIELARWFAEQARRLYGMMDETQAEQAHRELIDLIRGNGGSISKRELTHARRSRYPTAADCQDALDALQADGVGRWDFAAPGRDGGRPEARFVLTPPKSHNPP